MKLKYGFPIIALSMLFFSSEMLQCGPIRLERGKPTIQSSTLRNDLQFASFKANDDQAYDSSIAQTELETNPWWEIDLNGEYGIDNITVLAPVSFGAGWLRTFQVLLSSDGLNYKLIYTHDGALFRNRAIPAGGLTARFVRIRLQEHQILALQEVWIFQEGSVPAGPRPIRWTPVQIPGARHPGTDAGPTPSTPTPITCSSIVGTWTWFNGRTVTITPGSITDGSGKGTWSKTGPQVFQLHWTTYNTTDTITLSNDGSVLTGIFNGNKGTCRRTGGDCMAAGTPVTAPVTPTSPPPAPPSTPITCSSIIGTWTWFNGRTVTITPGSITDGSGKGTWSKTGPQVFQLHWTTYNTTDTITLSNDGSVLTGIFNGNKGTCRRTSGDCMNR